MEAIGLGLDCIDRAQNSEHRLSLILDAVKAEYLSAADKHSPFASTHEGAAVLREEFEEMWDEIKADNPKAARKEAVQVAAMAIRFIFDVGNHWSD